MPRHCPGFSENAHRLRLVFTLLVFVYFFVVERASTAERYWKKILYQADRYAWLFRPLQALDEALLPRLPMLGLLCWNMVIQVTRPPAR